MTQKNSKDLSKSIADKISFIPSLWSNIKINLKENENKMNDENLKYYEKKFSMLEIERKNYLAKKKFETETNIHKTFILNLLIFMLAFISVSLTLLGTNVLDNIFSIETVVNIKSVLTIMLMFSVMFISYFLSSQLGLIREKFYNLFKLSIIIILACITVSVYFNFMFLQSILTIDNEIIKIFIALLKSILLDVSISVLLFYRNCRQTLSFSFNRTQTYLNQNETYVKTDKKNLNIPQTEIKKSLTEANINQTEVKQIQTEHKKPLTDSKHNLNFDEKLNMVKNVIDSLTDNEILEYKTMTHFLKRYDWDKAKKILQNENLIYIENRQCKKTPNKIKLIK